MSVTVSYADRMQIRQFLQEGTFTSIGKLMEYAKKLPEDCSARHLAHRLIIKTIDRLMKASAERRFIGIRLLWFVSQKAIDLPDEKFNEMLDTRTQTLTTTEIIWLQENQCRIT